MVDSTTRPGVIVSPITLAQADAMRAIRHLGNVRPSALRAATPADHEALTAALGAALALQVDVQDALRALNAQRPAPPMTEGENRAQDGLR